MKRTKTDKILSKFRMKPVSTGNNFVLPNNSGDHQRGLKRNTPVNDIDLANKKYVDDNITAHPHAPAAHTHTHASTTGQTANDHHAEVHSHTHASTTGQTADDHHPRSHTIAEHDTTATGTQLNTLTGGGDTNLHDHDGISENTTHRSSAGTDHSQVNANETAIALNTAASHAQAHTVASHSDTTITGVETETLSNDSMADSLHRHSELSASDGSPNPAVSVDIAGTALMRYGANVRTGPSGDSIIFSDSGGASYWNMWLSGNDLRFWSTQAPTGDKLTITGSGKIGIGTTAPAASAKLEIASTSGALLIPRMTTAQKNNLTAVNGMIVYDLSLKLFCFYENYSWVTK